MELHLGSPGLIIRGGATPQLVRYLGRGLEEKGGLGSSQQKEELKGLAQEPIVSISSPAVSVGSTEARLW